MQRIQYWNPWYRRSEWKWVFQLEKKELRQNWSKVIDHWEQETWKEQHRQALTDKQALKDMREKDLRGDPALKEKDEPLLKKKEHDEQNPEQTPEYEEQISHEKSNPKAMNERRPRRRYQYIKHSKDLVRDHLRAPQFQ